METMQSSTSNCNTPAGGAPINDNFSDSGYGSRFSTPNEGEGSLAPKMSSDTQPESLVLDVGRWPIKKKLKVFERQISELAICQLQDWKVLFSGVLWESVSKAAPSTSDFNIAMKLKHLGTSEVDSRLYLVFFCDKRLAKHVRRFVTQGHVLEEMRGQFIPQVISRGPRLLHGEEVYTPITLEEETSCGTVLYYFSDNDRKAKNQSELSNPNLSVGTLGGIVMVYLPEGVRFYGLTTRHLFEVEESSIAQSPETDEESDEEDWDEVELDDELPSSIAESSTREMNLSHKEVSPKDVPLLGTREDLGHDRNLRDAKPGDWALIRLSERRLVDHNIIPSHRGQHGLQNDLRDRNSLRHNEVTGCGKRLAMGECRQVLVITNHGNLTGSLRHYGSSVITQGQGMGPMDVYDLLLEGSRLLHGDSGSWVVDLHTSKVFGHVIASDVLAEAYVLPMADILQQIRDLSDAQDAKIPTTSEIMAYNRAKNNPNYGAFPDEGSLSSAFGGFRPSLYLFDMDISILDYQGYRKQGRTPLYSVESIHSYSDESRSSADSMASRATASTLPTIQSFDEDAEANEYVAINKM
ncbi:hypothetical protein LZ30DRAFT_369305 [Colletotrichum cereale]|nr:hypothetical protein LZ30DRAFT_369305 [Colletotrichum cereale]